MATTTNYGWVTPDDTALVKDGAAAIRTLGSSADTTTKNLNPETTLGDLSFRSSTSNVNTRIGIGTAGQNLTVVAGVPAWATASSGGMTLLSTTTLAGASTTISITPTGYVDLAVYVQGVTLSVDQTFAIQYNAVTASDYQNLQHYIDNSTAGTATQFGADRIYMYLFAVDTIGTTSDNQFIINFYNCNSSERKIIEAYGQYNSARNYIFSQTATLYGNTAAVTELKFLTGSTFTAGTVLVYGVK